MTFLTDTLSNIKKFLVESGGEISSADHIEEISFTPQRLDLRDATTVHEGGMIQDLKIARSNQGDLSIRWFTDGIQKTFLIGTFDFGSNPVTVHYSIIASLIIGFRDGGFEMWGEPRIQEFALISKDLLGAELPKGFLDTGENTGYFGAQRYAAVMRARQERHKLEASHLYDWAEKTKYKEKILVDGSLSHLPKPIPCAVGLCKDNHPLFFTPETQRNILSLGYSERSALFSYSTPQKDEITSWFLRIRQPRAHSANFGLIRPEVYEGMPLDPGSVDEVSRLVFSLRNPVAYPSPKWERLVYPLKICTDFLTNHLPKVETIKWFLHGAIVT